MRHLLGIEIALEGDEFGLGRGLDELDEIAKGKTDPGNNDGPGFDAAMAIDAFLERGDFQDFVHGELAGLFDFALDGDRPRGGVEVLGVFRRIAFIGSEFVEIVVVSHVFEGILFFRRAEGALGEAGELGCGESGLRGGCQFEQSLTCDGGRADDAHSLEELPAVQVHGPGRHIGVRQIRGFADQHLFSSRGPVLVLLPYHITYN